MLVLRGALALPKSYASIDKYIIDALIVPKWKDKSDEKRKGIGKRFPKDSISVFKLPFFSDPKMSFQSILESNSDGYLDAIEKLTSELLKLPEKRSLNGGLMDGQTLADLAQRLAAVMNDHEKWDKLNPNFYELFEKEVCEKSAKKRIQPILELCSQEIERHRLRALNKLRSNCRLEEYVIKADDLIQSTLDEKREREKWRREMEEERIAMKMKLEAQREKDQGILTGGIMGIIGRIARGAGYAYLAPLLSDVQLKEKVTVLNNSEYETIGLHGVEWVWSQDAERLGLSGKGSGVVAQEVELPYP